MMPAEPLVSNGILQLPEYIYDWHRELLHDPEVEILIREMPELHRLSYRLLVGQLMDCRPFKLDSEDLSTGRDELGLSTGQALPAGQYRAFTEDLHRLADRFSFLTGCSSVRMALRNFFCPGDSSWHLDELNATKAYRFLWPLGRKSGMRYTPRANVNITQFRYAFSRLLPRLRKVDAAAFNLPGRMELILSQHARDINTLRAGTAPFIKDPKRIYQVPRGWASLHRIETPSSKGTFHANCFENIHMPGLQVIFTLYN